MMQLRNNKDHIERHVFNLDKTLDILASRTFTRLHESMEFGDETRGFTTKEREW